MIRRVMLLAVLCFSATGCGKPPTFQDLTGAQAEPAATTAAKPAPVLENREEERPEFVPEPPPKPDPATVIADFQKLEREFIEDKHLASLVELGDAIGAIDELNLDSSRVTPEGALLLPRFSGVRKLHLGKVPLNERAMAAIGTMTSLEELSLATSPLTSEWCRHLEDLVNLRDLQLSETRITDPAFQHFAKLSKLESLDVSYNPIDGSGFIVFDRMGAGNPLKRVSADHTNFGQWGFKYVKNWKQLEFLNVAFSGIDDAGLEFGLTGMPNLKELNVVKNSVGDLGVRRIASLPGLERVHLRNNRGVTDRGVAFFRGHKNLKFIDIADTSCSAAAVPFLQKECPDAIVNR